MTLKVIVSCGAVSCAAKHRLAKTRYYYTVYRNGLSAVESIPVYLDSLCSMSIPVYQVRLHEELCCSCLLIPTVVLDTNGSRSTNWET